MRAKTIWIVSAMLMSGCTTAWLAPKADWSNLRMGMSYAEVVKIVGPPQRRLQSGDYLEGAILPGTDRDVYIWQAGEVTKSASFSSDHLNGITNPYP